MSALSPAMSLRKRWSIVIVLAVLVAPAMTSAAAARAAVPDHQMQMMEAGHCKSMPSSHHDNGAAKSCCIWVSIAVAAAPSQCLAETPLRVVGPHAAVPTLHRLYLGEIATPPPRQA